MKNKIRIIDVSMLSSYMGRWQTVFVAVFVVGTAVSAFFSGGGQRNIIYLAVPAETSDEQTMERYEPLRLLVARQTRRPVVLVPCRDKWPADGDLFVMGIGDFLESESALGLKPLYEGSSTGRRSDSAVLIAPAGEADVDLASLSVAEVAFGAPRSINACWLQLAALARMGFRAPRDLGELRFEGTGAAVSRLVLAVLYGPYRVGACRLSDLTTLSEVGLIRPGEVSVIYKEPTLPELIISSREGEGGYYRRKLRAVETQLADVRSPANQDETVELLKAFGLRALQPASAERIQRAREAYDAVFGPLRVD